MQHRKKAWGQQLLPMILVGGFLGTIGVAKAMLAPKPNTFLELLLVKEQTYGLGFLPASGVATVQLDLGPGSGYAQGMTIYAQATLNYPGEQRRSNSVPLVLR